MDVENLDFEAIKELMEALQQEMEPVADDFATRLGRAKPEVKVMKLEGDLSPKGMGDVMHDDEEDELTSMLGDNESLEDEMGDEDDDLAARLMRLRSA